MCTIFLGYRSWSGIVELCSTLQDNAQLLLKVYQFPLPPIVHMRFHFSISLKRPCIVTPLNFCQYYMCKIVICFGVIFYCPAYERD